MFKWIGTWLNWDEESLIIFWNRALSNFLLLLDLKLFSTIMGQLRDTIAKLKLTEELLLKYQPLPVYTPLTPQKMQQVASTNATSSLPPQQPLTPTGKDSMHWFSYWKKLNSWIGHLFLFLRLEVPVSSPRKNSLWSTTDEKEKHKHKPEKADKDKKSLKESEKAKDKDKKEKEQKKNKKWSGCFSFWIGTWVE